MTWAGISARKSDQRSLKSTAESHPFAFCALASALVVCTDLYVQRLQSYSPDLFLSSIMNFHSSRLILVW